jgi:hypothetical protein
MPLGKPTPRHPRCNKSGQRGQGRARPAPRPLALVRHAGQQLLDLDCDAVALHHHRAGDDREIVGEDADLVLLGGIEFDNGAAAKPQYLVDRHRGSAENHGDIE